MNRERDERWAYVALAVLACAYIVYRVYGAGGLTIPSVEGLGITSVDLSRLKLRELGRALPYVAAPLIAVLTELFRRRRAREARRQWEERVRTEGFVREEENVEVGIVKGGRGTFAADLRLTRAALYMLDRSGRRDPVRFALGPAGGSESSVTDARLIRAVTQGRPRVRVAVSEPAGLTFEFASVSAEAWWSDIRRLLGKSTRADDAQALEEGTEAPVALGRDERTGPTVRGGWGSTRTRGKRAAGTGLASGFEDKEEY
jgi:hypothetical protein